MLKCLPFAIMHGNHDFLNTGNPPKLYDYFINWKHILRRTLAWHIILNVCVHLNQFIILIRWLYNWILTFWISNSIYINKTLIYQLKIGVTFYCLKTMDSILNILLKITDLIFRLIQYVWLHLDNTHIPGWDIFFHCPQSMDRTITI